MSGITASGLLLGAWVTTLAKEKQVFPNGVSLSVQTTQWQTQCICLFIHCKFFVYLLLCTSFQRQHFLRFSLALILWFAFFPGPILFLCVYFVLSYFTIMIIIQMLICIINRERKKIIWIWVGGQLWKIWKLGEEKLQSGHIAIKKIYF